MRVELGLNEQAVNVNNTASLGHVGMENRVKATFERKVELQMSKGQILIIQVYDHVSKTLVGMGNVSLASLKDIITRVEVPLYNAVNLRARCTCVLEFQEAHLV